MWQACRAIATDSACCAWIGCVQGRVARLELAAGEVYGRSRTSYLKALPVHAPRRASAGQTGALSPLLTPLSHCQMLCEHLTLWGRGQTSSVDGVGLVACLVACRPGGFTQLQAFMSSVDEVSLMSHVQLWAFTLWHEDVGD